MSVPENITLESVDLIVTNIEAYFGRLQVKVVSGGAESYSRDEKKINDSINSGTHFEEDSKFLCFLQNELKKVDGTEKTKQSPVGPSNSESVGASRKTPVRRRRSSSRSSSQSDKSRRKSRKEDSDRKRDRSRDRCKNTGGEKKRRKSSARRSRNSKSPIRKGRGRSRSRRRSSSRSEDRRKKRSSRSPRVRGRNNKNMTVSSSPSPVRRRRRSSSKSSRKKRVPRSSRARRKKGKETTLSLSTSPERSRRRSSSRKRRSSRSGEKRSRSRVGKTQRMKRNDGKDLSFSLSPSPERSKRGDSPSRPFDLRSKIGEGNQKGGRSRSNSPPKRYQASRNKASKTVRSRSRSQSRPKNEFKELIRSEHSKKKQRSRSLSYSPERENIPTGEEESEDVIQILEENTPTDKHLKRIKRIRKLQLREEGEALNKLAEERARYYDNPNSHTDYKKKWDSFWYKKNKYLVAQGIDINSVDLVPEWQEV